MFDDVLGMATSCVDNFRSCAHDAFCTSIVDDVLSPILNEIVLLRSLSEEFHRESLEVEKFLQEAHSYHLNEVSR
jgi:hypothetical protein